MGLGGQPFGSSDCSGDSDMGINQLTGDGTAGPGNGSQVLTISPLAVTTGKIANLAVTTGKIADAAVTLAKMADLAQSLMIGRAAGAGTGVPQALTAAQVRTLLDLVVGTNVQAHSVPLDTVTATLSPTGAALIGSLDPLDVRQIAEIQPFGAAGVPSVWTEIDIANPAGVTPYVSPTWTVNQYNRLKLVIDGITGDNATDGNVLLNGLTTGTYSVRGNYSSGGTNNPFGSGAPFTSQWTLLNSSANVPSHHELEIQIEKGFQRYASLRSSYAANRGWGECIHDNTTEDVIGVTVNWPGGLTGRVRLWGAR